MLAFVVVNPIDWLIFGVTGMSVGYSSISIKLSEVVYVAHPAAHVNVVTVVMFRSSTIVAIVFVSEPYEVERVI